MYKQSSMMKYEMKNKNKNQKIKNKNKNKNQLHSKMINGDYLNDYRN